MDKVQLKHKQLMNGIIPMGTVLSSSGKEVNIVGINGPVVCDYSELSNVWSEINSRCSSLPPQ